jgi:tetratricopeptide (TPR) repeat protein
MVPSIPRRASSILLIVLLLATLLLMAACSDDEEPSTSGASVTAATGSSSGSGESTSTPGTATGSDTTGGPTPPPVAPGGAIPPPAGPTGPSQTEGEGGPNYQEQLPDLEQAVEEEPESLEALQALAIGYYQTRQFEKAEETYRRMIELDDSAVFHNNLGNVYRDWGKTDEAISQYEKAIEIDPSLVLAYSNLATMYFTSNRLDEAREVLQQGIENASGPAKEQLETLLSTLQG